MVIALNMMDELTGSGGSIDIKAMEDSLTVPVVPITANSGEGVGELLRRAVEVAQNQQLPQRWTSAAVLCIPLFTVSPT